MISLSDINTLTRNILIGTVLFGGFILYTRWTSQPHYQPETFTNGVTVGPSISHGDASLPKPDAPLAGKITVIHSHVVTPKDTAGTVLKDTTIIYVTDDPHVPPIVHADSSTHVLYQRISDPWIQFQVDVMLGGSASNEGVSPYGEGSFVTLWDSFRLGIGLDEDGLGPALNWEFFREFNLGVTYRAVHFVDSTPWMATITYRF